MLWMLCRRKCLTKLATLQRILGVLASQDPGVYESNGVAQAASIKRFFVEVQMQIETRRRMVRVWELDQLQINSHIQETSTARQTGTAQHQNGKLIRG